MGYMVDGWLEDEYKVKKQSDRDKTRNWIVGMVLVFCNVWTPSALSAVRGGKVTYEEAAHYSTIINKLLTLLNDGAQDVVKKIQGHVNVPKNNNQESNMVNEGILNGKNACTPEKFIQMLGLQVVQNNNEGGMSDEEFNQKRDENMTQMYEMLTRMNNVNNPLYH